MRLLFLLVLLSGCGIPNKKSNEIERLQLAYDNQRMDFSSTAGWPSDVDNDGSLWAGLAARAGLSVNVADYAETCYVRIEITAPGTRPLKGPWGLPFWERLYRQMAALQGDLLKTV